MLHPNRHDGYVVRTAALIRQAHQRAAGLVQRNTRHRERDLVGLGLTVQAVAAKYHDILAAQRLAIQVDLHVGSLPERARDHMAV